MVSPLVPVRLSTISLDEVAAARQRIADTALRTPLVRLDINSTQAEIYLKLENLQPVGSFKIRGAVNALAKIAEEKGGVTQGVWTASVGNMGYALAWAAQQMGIPCAVIVPDDAPKTKLQAIARYGALIHPVPFSVYQQIQVQHAWRELADLPESGPLSGPMVHPFADPAVMAGNATIGLEILEEMPDVEAVFVPYGGGGLSCGIAAGVKAVRHEARVVACEVETAAPLAASLAAGQTVEVSYTPSFVTGMGAPYVFPDMWPLAKQVIDSAQVVSLDQVRIAIRILAHRCHIIAEGAGAVPVAAALSSAAGVRKVVCVVSGGNIDAELLAGILNENDLSQKIPS